MPKTKIFLDVSYFWQKVGPTSVSIVGNSVFNKHLFFLLAFIVLFLVWLSVCVVYRVVEVRNQKKRKLLRSKKPEIVWLLVFLIVIPLVLLCDLTEIPVTGLEPTRETMPTEQELFLEINPKMYASDTVNKSQVNEICWMIVEFRKRGYSDERLHWSFWSVNASFWSLEYSEKIRSFQEHLDHEDKKIKDRLSNNTNSFFFFYLLFVFVFLVVPRIARGGR